MQTAVRGARSIAVAAPDNTIGWFGSDAWDWTKGAAASAAHIVTHPADSVSDAWHAVTHPLDSAEAVANGIVDMIHFVPGVDWAGDRLKEFANTSFGRTCLQIVATAGYYILAPYLGAFYSSIAFALPGVLKGDRFSRAWVSETAWRLGETIKYLTATYVDYEKLGIKGVADEKIKEALQKIGDTGVAQHLKGELTQGMKRLAEMAGTKIESEIKARLAEKFGDPPDLTKIARELGIREDMAAMAWDAITKDENFSAMKRVFDPITGNDVLAHAPPSPPPPPTNQFGTAQSIQRASTMALRLIPGLLPPPKPLIPGLLPPPKPVSDAGVLALRSIQARQKVNALQKQASVEDSAKLWYAAAGIAVVVAAGAIAWKGVR